MFLRSFCTKKRCFFDGFGRKNWVPSPLPLPHPSPLPSSSPTGSPVFESTCCDSQFHTKVTRKLVNCTQNSPRKAGYSRSMHMPAAPPFTVEGLHERITTEITNNNHWVASAKCVSLTRKMQLYPTDMSYTKIRDPAKSPASV